MWDFGSNELLATFEGSFPIEFCAGRFRRCKCSGVAEHSCDIMVALPQMRCVHLFFQGFYLGSWSGRMHGNHPRNPRRSRSTPMAGVVKCGQCHGPLPCLPRIVFPNFGKPRRRPPPRPPRIDLSWGLRCLTLPRALCVHSFAFS